MKKYLLLNILSLVLFLSQSACKREETANPDPIKSETLVDVGGYKLNTLVQGTGKATVVFLSGADSPLAYWQKVQSPIAANYATIAYDRSGYGASDLSSDKRDGATIAKELYKLLELQKLKPPYILVAHSLGGAFAQVFAAQYKNEVKGVVMVDCTSDKSLDFTADLPLFLFDDLKYEGSKREFKALRETVDQIKFLNGLPDKPLVVITNMKPADNENMASREDDFVQQGKWTKGKTNAQQWKSNYGHLIPVNDPEIIVKAINEVGK